MKPDSENSGVFSSCEAVAMKSRRAASSRACSVMSRSTTMSRTSDSRPTRNTEASSEQAGVLDDDGAVLAVGLRLGERLGDVGRQQLGERARR